MTDYLLISTFFTLFFDKSLSILPKDHPIKSVLFKCICKFYHKLNDLMVDNKGIREAAIKDSLHQWHEEIDRNVFYAACFFKKYISRK